jgi:hypothetical protein
MTLASNSATPLATTRQLHFHRQHRGGMGGIWQLGCFVFGTV